MSDLTANAPTVSVIMPTFNRLQFLRATVGSLFGQSYSDWELVIADDGSDSETRAFLAALQAPPRVRVLWLPHSGRPGVARNAALRQARGRYVAFLDSDDLWLAHKLSAQLTSLRAHPQRHWSYTAFQLVGADGKQLRRAAQESAARSGWILESILNGETIVALPSVVVERDLLERLGAFDEQLTMCEDDELWLRLAAHCEADAIDEPLTCVRRHGVHGGDDVTAWRDRRRVFEQALRRRQPRRVRSLLRRERAHMSAGLAGAQANAGEPHRALLTLAASAGYSWRYRGWWRGALRCLAYVALPTAMRARLRRTSRVLLRLAGAR
jgi:glycosyltransferase involved in cell wall biosynthesis